MGTKIRCPKCKWEPDGKPYWQCSCLHRWNTFETYGQCPNCGKKWDDTQCIYHVSGCSQWSAHVDWYEELDDFIEDIFKVPEKSNEPN